MHMESTQKNAQSIEIVEAYQRMELIPGQLDYIVSRYANQIQDEDKRHADAMEAIIHAFEDKKKRIGAQRDSAYREAEAAKQTIISQLNDLSTEIETAEGEYNKAFSHLQSMGKNPVSALGQGLAAVFYRVASKKKATIKEFWASYNRLLDQENSVYKEKLYTADYNYQAQIDVATKEYNESLRAENSKTESNIAAFFEMAKQAIADLDPATIKEQSELLRMGVPASINYEAAQEMPRTIDLGFLKVDMGEWFFDQRKKPVANLIRENFSFALKNSQSNSELLFPYGISFADSRINKLITYDISNRAAAIEFIRSIEMRLFMSIPCGKLRVTMIDPIDSGSNFSMFSCLGDYDERIISSRIWYEPKRIKERLSLLIAQIAHVNQDCLRNEYEDIIAYNEFVGKNAEPLQALFVADFPRQFDLESCEMLEKIVSSGPRCGIYTYIIASNQDLENCKFNLDGIKQVVDQMNCTQEEASYKYGEMEHKVQPISLPSKDEQAEIFEVLKNGIKGSDRIIIYFDEIADELTRHKEKWFKFDDANGIDVPIGLEGALRTVQLHLGGELITQHHALISGTIGSGKSTLLHTIIMSILLRYSPEDVQIYLLDFKRGVEFKIYAESKLPNFRVISLDTEPEFGLAVLKYLEQEQADRAQEFHDKKCDNIERYNEIAGADLENEISKIPRIVLIIDEFHEMFSKSDSDISKECARLLEQIVRQGRALGIHVILASQTLPDNLSKIYGQIMNRVVLQSTAEAAKYILDQDNDLLDKLGDLDPGKGVFNDGGGNRDANHEFRVAIFRDDSDRDVIKHINTDESQKQITQRELLIEIKKQQELCEQEGMFSEMEITKPRLLLSSIQDDDDNPLNRFVKTGELPARLEFGCPLYLGEEISMVNDFSIRLKARRAQNLLIMGQDYKRASLLYGFAAMSILFNAYRVSNGNMPKQPIITFFDFGKVNSSGSRFSKKSFDIMNELSARFPNLIRVFGKDSLMDGIELLNSEYQDDIRDTNSHYVIFAGLNRAKRLVETESAYSMPPKKRFENLVKTGPEKGYNFIIWANEPSSFFSYYNDMLVEFEYRLVYDLKEEQYEQVIKSSAMDTSYGNNVISYNPDEDNKKVRIYSMPLNEWFRRFMDRIEGTALYEDVFSDDDDDIMGEFGDEF